MSPDTVVHSCVREGGGQYKDKVTMYLSAEFLGPDDRVLMLDDVLSSGKMAAAVAELVSKTGATLVGCGFLIEKEFDQGRALLPRGVMTESVVSIKSVDNGAIEFSEPRL